MPIPRSCEHPSRPATARSVRRAVAPVWCFLLAMAAETGLALDHVSLTRDGKPLRVSGTIVTQAVDGGVLLLDREGVLWRVPSEELTGRSKDDEPFSLLKSEELKGRILSQLPKGFQVRATPHYLVFYNTSPAYAQWCAALYERLYRGFHSYWAHRDLELHDPPAPLIAIVFDSPSAYEQYARTELGAAASSMVGYYSLDSNRITTYDLTGTKGLQGGSTRHVGSTAQINRLLMQPGAEWLVATIIHEATHQLAYNCGLHARHADIPFWVSEGLAVFFETPDLKSSKGWNDIGGVNRMRLNQFHKYVQSRPTDSLTALLLDDKRFRQPKTAGDAYAEAWSLNFYLIRRRPKDYVRYLKTLAEKKPMVYDTPEQRLQDFTAAFGDGLRQIDADFVRFMSGVR